MSMLSSYVDTEPSSGGKEILRKFSSELIQILAELFDIGRPKDIAFLISEYYSSFGFEPPFLLSWESILPNRETGDEQFEYRLYFFPDTNTWTLCFASRHEDDDMENRSTIILSFVAPFRCVSEPEESKEEEGIMACTKVTKAFRAKQLFVEHDDRSFRVLKSNTCYLVEAFSDSEDQIVFRIDEWSFLKQANKREDPRFEIRHEIVLQESQDEEEKEQRLLPKKQWEMGHTIAVPKQQKSQGKQVEKEDDKYEERYEYDEFTTEFDFQNLFYDKEARRCWKLVRVDNELKGDLIACFLGNDKDNSLLLFVLDIVSRTNQEETRNGIVLFNIFFPDSFSFIPSAGCLTCSSFDESNQGHVFQVGLHKSPDDRKFQLLIAFHFCSKAEVKSKQVLIKIQEELLEEETEKGYNWQYLTWKKFKCISFQNFLWFTFTISAPPSSSRKMNYFLYRLDVESKSIVRGHLPDFKQDAALVQDLSLCISQNLVFLLFHDECLAFPAFDDLLYSKPSHFY